MNNFMVGLVFGVAGGLLIGGTVLHAQCCAMLDVPLNTQIEIEHQQMTGGWATPATPPHTNQDLWRETVRDKVPCR